MDEALLLIAPLVTGYVLDLLLGDPDHWPHPMRLFGNVIAFGERKLNHGRYRIWKGALLATSLVLIVYFILTLLETAISGQKWLYVVVDSIGIYYGLANKNLIWEG